MSNFPAFYEHNRDRPREGGREGGTEGGREGGREGGDLPSSPITRSLRFAYSRVSENKLRRMEYI